MAAKGSKRNPQSVDLFRAQFQKTVSCTFHASGRCRMGTKCRFAHNSVELRQAPDLTKTSLCQAFMRGEKCRNSAECPFAHGSRELRMTPMFQAKRKQKLDDSSQKEKPGLESVPFEWCQGLPDTFGMPPMLDARREERPMNPTMSKGIVPLELCLSLPDAPKMMPMSSYRGDSELESAPWGTTAWGVLDNSAVQMTQQMFQPMCEAKPMNTHHTGALQHVPFELAFSIEGDGSWTMFSSENTPEMTALPCKQAVLFVPVMFSTPPTSPVLTCANTPNMQNILLSALPDCYED